MKRFPIRHAAGALLLALGLLAAPGVSATPPLFEIQGRHATIYLLGSVHALRADDYPLPAPVRYAYRAAGTLVLEVDLSGDAAMNAARLAMQRGSLPAGRSLQDVLGPTDWARAQKLAGAAGVDLNALAGLRPWLAAMTVSDGQLLKAGFAPGLGVDRHFAQLASRDGKPILGLETLDYQVGLLAGLPDEEQKRFLLQTLEQSADFQRQLGELVRAWRNGDLDGLQKVLKDNFADDPALYRTLLVDRNRHWLERLTAMLGGSGTYFVVVGALHLPGPDGLLQGLREAGYPVIAR
ncbi:MAG: TraB/GumN family protein [Gammaproteobacteria bacterium]|jgi:hypothetical protein